MKALLLAAGYGSRLGQHTKTKPKCLIDVNGQTMLDHWLFKLEALGVESFIINTHYKSEQVENYISNHLLNSKITLDFEPELLGTAGTVARHSHELINSDCFIVHVDNYCQDNLQALLKSHITRPESTMLTMLTFTTSTPQTCGIVEVDQEGKLIGFYEKQIAPPSNMANGAVFIASPAFFEFIKEDDRVNLDLSRDIVPTLLGKIFCVHTEAYFEDIGIEEKLFNTRAKIQASMQQNSVQTGGA